MSKIVLASSSPYRKTQLETLGLPFVCANPDINESAQKGETAQTLAARLAAEKVQAIAEKFPNAFIIGADQTLAFEDQILGKPGSYEAAVQQLKALSGKTVVLHSALALLDVASNNLQHAVVPTTVRYRALTDAQIAFYLQQDKPFDCAGSCKSESLGIALLESVTSSDHSALVGLPLIALTTMLNNVGLSPLQAHSFKN
ncbi:MAG: Maf family nucleotide pyrophosphatase [Pseudomonadales bacterium]